MIDDFILIKYKSKTNPALQEKLFWLMTRQLRIFYPQAKINVLTDEVGADPRLIYHVNPIENNHMSKLQLFGLLDRPAMYLDCDLLIVRPFQTDELPLSLPFHVYRTVTQPNWKILPQFDYPHHNNGVIWIPRPSQKLTKELIDLKEKHFADKKLYLNNDEFVTNRYIHDMGWKMNLGTSVNIFRVWLQNKLDIDNCQSVHYVLAKESLEFDIQSRIKLQ